MQFKNMEYFGDHNQAPSNSSQEKEDGVYEKERAYCIMLSNLCSADSRGDPESYIGEEYVSETAFGATERSAARAATSSLIRDRVSRGFRSSTDVDWILDVLI